MEYEQKNSSKIKEILIDMTIECELPSDMNELDETIFNFTNIDKKSMNEKLSSLYLDCDMALDDTWDRSDDGFRAMQENIEDIAKLLKIELKYHPTNIND